MPVEQVIPMQYPDVLDWAAVVRNPDEKEKLYKHILAYAVSGPLKEVVIDVQGFVGKVNIHPLGDWNPKSVLSSVS